VTQHVSAGEDYGSIINFSQALHLGLVDSCCREGYISHAQAQNNLYQAINAVDERLRNGPEKFGTWIYTSSGLSSIATDTKRIRLAAGLLASVFLDEFLSGVEDMVYLQRNMLRQNRTKNLIAVRNSLRAKEEVLQKCAGWLFLTTEVEDLRSCPIWHKLVAEIMSAAGISRTKADDIVTTAVRNGTQTLRDCWEVDAPRNFSSIYAVMTFRDSILDQLTVGVLRDSQRSN